jgi:pimeloyl-ACP methyl ester carboxylesterase
MTSHYAELNGVRLHYDVEGEGEPLALVHAGVANLHLWDDQMAAFTQHFRVVRHDVRGFGETPDPPGNYTDHDDLHALLQHLGIKQTNLLGVSNGGRIALEFAIAFPHMMKKLVLIAPGVPGFENPVTDQVAEDKEAQAEEAKKRGDFDLAAELEAQVWVDGPRRTAAQVDPVYRAKALKLLRHTVAIPLGEGIGDILRPPAAGRLHEVKAPTLLVIGDQDVANMFPIMDALEAGIPNNRRVNLENIAHLPNLENPELFNRIVLDFLTEH